MIRKKCVKIDKERQNLFYLMNEKIQQKNRVGKFKIYKMSDYLYYEGAIFFNSVMIKKIE